jgi:hypothetical protein
MATKTTAARRAGETPEYTLRTRLTFQAHALFRAVRLTARVVSRRNLRTSSPS